MNEIQINEHSILLMESFNITENQTSSEHYINLMTNIESNGFRNADVKVGNDGTIIRYKVKDILLSINKMEKELQTQTSIINKNRFDSIANNYLLIRKEMKRIDGLENHVKITDFNMIYSENNISQRKEIKRLKNNIYSNLCLTMSYLHYCTSGDYCGFNLYKFEAIPNSKIIKLNQTDTFLFSFTTSHERGNRQLCPKYVLDNTELAKRSSYQKEFYIPISKETKIGTYKYTMYCYRNKYLDNPIPDTLIGTYNVVKSCIK